MAPCEITEDYYAILEVPQNATHEVIRKSYRRLALALHPDRNLKKACATASFQRVCHFLSQVRSFLFPPSSDQFESSRGHMRQSTTLHSGRRTICSGSASSYKDPPKHNRRPARRKLRRPRSKERHNSRRSSRKKLLHGRSSSGPWTKRENNTRMNSFTSNARLRTLRGH